MRKVLLLIITLWSVVDADYYNGFVYEEEFYGDHFTYDIPAGVATPLSSSLELQQLTDDDATLGTTGNNANSPSPRVARDVRHQAYDHWIRPSPVDTSKTDGHILKRDISNIEGNFEVSSLDGHYEEDDEVTMVLDEDQIDMSRYQVPATNDQHEESLEGHYQEDSHEEPAEERAHGVKARQPRDGEEEVDKEDGHRQKVRVIRKRTIRHTAKEYEEAIQAAIDEFNAEQAQERAIKEKKKREITAALSTDDGAYTEAELEKAVEDALDEYYAQCRINRLKRTADVDSEYERAIQEAINDYNRQNMIIEVQSIRDTKVKRDAEELAIDNGDRAKWSYISPINLG